MSNKPENALKKNDGFSTANIEAQLSEKLASLFDLVVADRSKHFAEHPNDIPHRNSVSGIVNGYAVQNAAISGGSSLLPGPLGLLAVIPEIALVVRNQLAMIYDIGMAHGKEKAMTRELLAGVLLTAFGSSTSALLFMHGGKVLVKRVTLRFFQQIVGILAGRVTQQVLKSTISKFFPVVGAAAMAAWSGYMTHQIGKKAVEIFEKEIDVSDVAEGSESEETIEYLVTHAASGENLSDQLELQKIKTLINLMMIDGAAKDTEKQQIKEAVSKTSLSEDEKLTWLQSIENSEKFVVDYTDLKNSPDDAIGLLVDMVALAKRDGQFHITEKMFIKKTGATLGFSESDVEEMMLSAA
jgi:uncharacterized tellurite resistance protein B-like protein